MPRVKPAQRRSSPLGVSARPRQIGHKKSRLWRLRPAPTWKCWGDMGTSPASRRFLLGSNQFPLYGEAELFIVCVRRVRPRLQLTPTTKMAPRCRSYTWDGTQRTPSSADFNIYASAAWRSRLCHAPRSNQQGSPQRADCSAELTSMIMKSRKGTKSA